MNKDDQFGYTVSYTMKNGKHKVLTFKRYWDALLKKLSLERANYTNISMQKKEK